MEFKQYVCCCNELDPAMNQKKYVYIYIHHQSLTGKHVSLWLRHERRRTRCIYCILYTRRSPPLICHSQQPNDAKRPPLLQTFVVASLLTETAGGFHERGWERLGFVIYVHLLARTIMIHYLHNIPHSGVGTCTCMSLSSNQYMHSHT